MAAINEEERAAKAMAAYQLELKKKREISQRIKDLEEKSTRFYTKNKKDGRLLKEMEAIKKREKIEEAQRQQ